MTPLTSVLRAELYLRRDQINMLKALFERAESSHWDQVVDAINKDPSLMNQRMDDSGITLLWIAASHVASIDEDQVRAAVNFIQNVLDRGFILDINANFDNKSVLWLLCKSISYMEEPVPIYCLNEKLKLMKELIEVCPDFNMNVVSCGKSIGQLLTYSLVRGSGLLTKMMILASQELDPSFILCLHSRLHRIEMSHKVWFGFRTTLYHHYIKMLASDSQKVREEITAVYERFPDPYMRKHKSKTLLEAVLDWPPSKERKKLLIYLIFLGAKITETADLFWKKEYEFIQKRLLKVFKRAHVACLYPLNKGGEFLLPEIRYEVAFKIIWTAIPELQDFPISLIKKRLLYGTPIKKQNNCTIF